MKIKIKLDESNGIRHTKLISEEKGCKSSYIIGKIMKYTFLLIGIIILINSLIKYFHPGYTDLSYNILSMIFTFSVALIGFMIESVSKICLTDIIVDKYTITIYQKDLKTKEQIKEVFDLSKIKECKFLLQKHKKGISKFFTLKLKDETIKKYQMKKFKSKLFVKDDKQILYDTIDYINNCIQHYN